VRARRAAAVALVLAGAALMLAAPQTLSGAVMIGLGIVIELAGIALERRH